MIQKRYVFLLETSNSIYSERENSGCFFPIKIFSHLLNYFFMDLVSIYVSNDYLVHLNTYYFFIFIYTLNGNYSALDILVKMNDRSS